MLRTLRRKLPALLTLTLWAGGVGGAGGAWGQEWRAARPQEAVAPEPLREFRGVWVATVANIDWPTSRTAGVAEQRAEMVKILDAARAANFNAVVFQARPCCDAMYKSSLEPWSEFLTGESGKAPLGEFDPLAEWVAAAHERGMELHAWVNPFRARHFDEKKPAAASHISRTRPELVKAYDRFQWLDPGEAEAQEHTFRVIADLLARYDLDGLHIDDYFYPYPKGTDPFPDGPSWEKYRSGGGPLARDDWRRDNINRFVKRLYETTKATRRPVKVGISPFGIWKPGYPAGVDGMDSTVKIFADAKLWLREGWMDYCSPQLYWKIDAPKQPFEPLLAWWSGENVRHRALWPGLYTSRLLPAEMEKGGGWSTAEIVRQVELIKKGVPASPGAVHFSARAIATDASGVRAALAAGPYAAEAVVPAMPWLDATPPPAPQCTVVGDADEVRVSWTPGVGEAAAVWSIAVRAGGFWTLAVAPPGERTFTARGSGIDAVSVRAVDRSGNLSPAAPMVPDISR